MLRDVEKKSGPPGRLWGSLASCAPVVTGAIGGLPGYPLGPPQVDNLPHMKPVTGLICLAAGELPGVGDDGAQVGVLRRPAQAVAKFLTAGHQGGGIAFAARSNHIRDLPAGDFLHCRSEEHTSELQS